MLPECGQETNKVADNSAMGRKTQSSSLRSPFDSLLRDDDIAGLKLVVPDEIRVFRFEDDSDLLIQSVKSGAGKIARWLVNDLNFQEIQDEKGRTALHYAADGKNLPLYAFLAEAGWDVMLKDKAGQTPSNLVLKALI